MLYHSVLFSTEVEGPDRVQTASVGRLFRGRRVLSISGGDPVCITVEGGETHLVPAGSVLHTEGAAPAPKVTTKGNTAVPPKVELGAGGVRAVTFMDGFRQRTIKLGDLMAGSWVTSFVKGDPATVVLANGSVGMEFSAGSVSKWTMA
jgi:hypothetical protein